MAGFYIAGTLVLISGLILLLLPLVEHFQQRRTHNLEPSNEAFVSSALIGLIGGVHIALVWQSGSPPPDVTTDKPPETYRRRMSLTTLSLSLTSWNLNPQES